MEFLLNNSGSKASTIRSKISGYYDTSRSKIRGGDMTINRFI